MITENESNFALEILCDRFYAARRQRLFAKKREGSTGWDHKTLEGEFKKALINKTLYGTSAANRREEQKKHLVDVSNYAMFLWNMLCKEEDEKEGTGMASSGPKAKE